MKKLIFAFLITFGTFFISSHVQARCGYYVGWGYRCFGDQGGSAAPSKAAQHPQAASTGINSLSLIIDCSASGKAVDWINTASLQCGDDRYDALANQTGPSTLSAYFRSVPSGESCQLSVGSGFDSKVLGTVTMSGSAKKRINAKCAW